MGLILQTQPVLVKEGLLGGVLNKNWPLLNTGVAGRLIYEGKKKIDGRTAYLLEYRTERRSDLRIHLYFDSETYRHLMSVYTFSVILRMA